MKTVLLAILVASLLTVNGAFCEYLILKDLGMLKSEPVPTLAPRISQLPVTY